MDRQAMIDFAQRIVHAPDNDARVHELVHLAPDSALARLGLARAPSAFDTVVSIGGALLVGAVIGAGAALLLTPKSGPELQEQLRGQAKRLSRQVKKAADEAEERISELADDAKAHANGEAPSSGSYGPHA